MSKKKAKMVASYWREVGSALGVMLPSDEEMDFGPCGPDERLNEKTGNWEKRKPRPGYDKYGNKVE